MTHPSHTWRPFIAVSLALCIGTMGTALSSPLYPLYQHSWQLMPSQITYIFVAYMFGCLATLLFLGRSSNSIGFVRSLQLGLGFAIIGLLCSAFATEIYLLGFGRFIIGIASGLISTSAMLGLIYTIPASHKANAPQLSSIITVIGFASGPLLGGTIAQFVEAPLRTPYLPIIAAACLSVLSLNFLKTPAFEKQKFSIAPHLQRPIPTLRPVFYLASFSAFSSFAVFSMFASLAPSYIAHVIPWHGPMVTGATITSILIFSVIAQIAAKNIHMQRSLSIGLITLFISAVALMICVLLDSRALFFISVIFAGLGHGLSLIGAFGFIHKITTDKDRAAIMATYLFIAYWGSIAPIMGMGYLADHWGLNVGIFGFSLLMCVIVSLLWWRQRGIDEQFCSRPMS